MTIQSQLDQVLALFDLPDTPLNGVLVAEHCYAFMKEHGPAIRAAVGGVGETVAWWREDHVCHAHELTTADALADGYKPCVIKCEDCAWNASLCDTHGAVGGEAVAWQFRSKLLTGAGWSDWSECSAGDADYYSRKGAAVQVRQLYASPTATVDVGALREFIARERDKEYRAESALAVGNLLDELAALIGKEA